MTRLHVLASMLVMAGCVPATAGNDAGTPGTDTGTTPLVDTGSPASDAGPPPRDGGPSTPYAALVPDATHAGELAFGVHVAGAFFAQPGFDANGDMFLFVDRAGTWWAQRYSPLEVRTGTLDAATLAELNAELLTGPWSAVDGERVTSCCDGPTTYLARDDVRASVYQFAPGASDRLTALITTSGDWIMRLSTEGAPMTGDVRLELNLLPGGAGSEPTIPWPLSTPLADVLAGANRSVTVFTAADADTLRATRRGIFAEGTVVASFLVGDVLPFADADGCLRPIGGAACR